MKWSEFMRYIVLVCILVGGGLAFYYVRASTSLQLMVGIIMSAAYVLWGIIHHTVKKELHMRVVIEYILMGTIAVVLLATILRA